MMCGCAASDNSSPHDCQSCWQSMAPMEGQLAWIDWMDFVSLALVNEKRKPKDKIEEMWSKYDNKEHDLKKKKKMRRRRRRRAFFLMMTTFLLTMTRKKKKEKRGSLGHSQTRVLERGRERAACRGTRIGDAAGREGQRDGGAPRGGETAPTTRTCWRKLACRGGAWKGTGRRWAGSGRSRAPAARGWPSTFWSTPAGWCWGTHPVRARGSGSSAPRGRSAARSAGRTAPRPPHTPAPLPPASSPPPPRCSAWRTPPPAPPPAPRSASLLLPSAPLP